MTSMSSSEEKQLCRYSVVAADNTQKLLNHFRWSYRQLMLRLDWKNNPSTFYKLLNLGYPNSPYTEWPVSLMANIAQVFGLTVDQLQGGAPCDLLTAASDPRNRWNPSKQRPDQLLDLIHEHSFHGFHAVCFSPDGIPIHLLPRRIQARMVAQRYSKSPRSARRNLSAYITVCRTDMKNAVVPYDQTELLVPQSRITTMMQSAQFTIEEKESIIEHLTEAIWVHEFKLRLVHDTVLSPETQRVLSACNAFSVIGNAKDAVVIRRPPDSDVLSWTTNESPVQGSRQQLEWIRSLADRQATKDDVTNQLESHLRAASRTVTRG